MPTFLWVLFPISVWFQKQNVKEKPRFYEDDECFFEKNVVVFVFFRKIHFVVVSFIVETVETAELPIFVGKK